MGESSWLDEDRRKGKRGIIGDEMYRNIMIKLSKRKGLTYEKYVGKAMTTRRTGDNCTCLFYFFFIT